MKTQIPCCYASLAPDSLWSWNTCRELQHFDRHLYICGENHWGCCFSQKDKDTFFGIRGRHLFLDSGSGLVLSTATLRPSFRVRSQAETHCCQEPRMSWSSWAQTVKTNHYTHLRCFPPKLLNQIHLISDLGDLVLVSGFSVVVDISTHSVHIRVALWNDVCLEERWFARCKIQNRVMS